MSEPFFKPGKMYKLATHSSSTSILVLSNRPDNGSHEYVTVLVVRDGVFFTFKTTWLTPDCWREIAKP